MSGVLESSVEDHGFNPQSSETKIYNIGICSFSDQHASLMNKNKYWLVPRSRKNWRYQSGNQKPYIDVEHSDNAKENGITMFYKTLHRKIEIEQLETHKIRRATKEFQKATKEF